MRHFRFLLAALALMLTTSTFAAATPGFEENRGSISYEIEKMLKDSGLIIEESFEVKVIFKVTGDMRIDIRQISSPNEEVNEFLVKRLDNQKLHGSSWYSNQIYELPVKVHSRR